MTKLPRLLDASNHEVRRVYPLTLNIIESAVPLSTATMKLPKNQVIPDRSYLELFTPNGSAGIFRNRTPINDYGGGYLNTYNLEHAICEVGDYIVHTDIEQTEKTLAAAVQQVFTYYGGSKWQLGTVSVNGTVILSAYNSNVLQTINSLIDQVSGAIMTFDFSTSPWTFNIVSLSNEVTAEGRLSRNVSNAQIKKDDSNLCTRVWLKGLTNGKMDADTIGQYGVVEKSLPDKDYTSTQANVVATAYLEKYKQPIYSVTIDGMDFFSVTGESLDKVAIGKLYRLAIPEDNVTLCDYITKINWKDVINTPTVVALTLSEPTKTLVNYIQKQQKDYYGAGGGYETQERKKDEIWSKLIVTETAIETEVGRATAAENGKIDKTSILQTADQIVAEAVSQSATDAGNTYIAKTSTLQTATQIVNEAVTQAATAAGNTYIAKTSTLHTADQIVTEAVTQSATAAGNTYIAKTSTLQTATQIVNEAVTQSATDAGNTYIAKTTTYQTADSIVSEAHNYSDGHYNTLDSRITQQANEISLVVTGTGQNASINSAAIIAAINNDTSSVTISASQINLQGNVSITDLSEYDSSRSRLDVTDLYADSIALGGWASVGTPVSGSIYADYVIADNGTITTAQAQTLTANDLYVSNDMYYQTSLVEVVPITINGTTYMVFTLQASQGGGV